jgi:hypothetical protein
MVGWIAMCVCNMLSFVQGYAVFFIISAIAQQLCSVTISILQLRSLYRGDRSPKQSSKNNKEEPKTPKMTSLVKNPIEATVVPTTAFKNQTAKAETAESV